MSFIARFELSCIHAFLRVYSMHRRGADSDTDRTFVLREHAYEPLEREIERIESLLASCSWRHRQEAVRS